MDYLRSIMSPAPEQKKPIKMHPIHARLKPLYNNYIAAQTNQSKLLIEAEILWNNCTQIEESVFDTIKVAIDKTVHQINLVVQNIENYKDAIEFRQSDVSEHFNRDDRSIIDYDAERFEVLKDQNKDLNKNKKVILKILNKALAEYEAAKKWQTWWEGMEPIFKAQNRNRPTKEEKATFTLAVYPAVQVAEGRHKKSKRKQGKQSKRRQRKPKKKQTKSK